MRPLLQIPKWDGKIVLGGIFIVGYYTLLLVMLLGTRDLSGEKANIVRDAMLTLGPPIGVIIGALFRTTAAEERRDANRSAELTTAITTPSTLAPSDIGKRVEEGAADGTERGVQQALGTAAPGAERAAPGAPPPYSPGAVGIID